MTLIELRDFAKWFVRDIVADVYGAVIAVLAWMFRAPIAAVKSHAKEYRNDPGAAWVRMIMICLVWIAMVQAIAFSVGLAITPNREAMTAHLFGSMLGTAAMLVVYALSVLVTVKVEKFRSERQRMLDTLTGK